MIPQANILDWRAKAPWKTANQVEQDLIISRALVELFSQKVVAENLAFRGGTALHKLHLAPAARYSEDIDLVQVGDGQTDRIIDVVRQALGFLGEPLPEWRGGVATAVRQTANLLGRGVRTLTWRFQSETPPTTRLRLKLEINTRERFNVLGLKKSPFAVDSDWFRGQCDLTTYHVDELLGTKMRAQYQRTKGRDLFDLWYGLTFGKADPAKMVDVFRRYLKEENKQVSQRQFRDDLAAKVKNPDYLADTEDLLRPGLDYNYEEAHRFVDEHLMGML
ncbi:MAG: nucleotidyl transferase AbiEii/AbiGii toxin family protein [Verrucomicrobia bacterium]|nr:nucleotidyl transferase AbiEii/AbiGii toxin family protein [Verrucomicrobiota bacterium]